MISLTQNSLQNLQHYWQLLAAIIGGQIVSDTTCIRINTTLNTPIFNQIYHAKIETIKDYQEYKEKNDLFFKGHAYSWWQLQNTEVDKLFQQLNLTHFGIVPVMVRETVLDISCQTLSPHIELIQIEKENDIMRWAELYEKIWQLSKEDTIKYLTALQQCHDKFCQFKAIDTQNNQVIGTSSLLCDSAFAGLYNLCIHPAYRNQGIATALHALAVKSARTLGYRYITLQSTPMGISLGRRIGYETVAQYNIYY